MTVDVELQLDPYPASVAAARKSLAGYEGRMVAERLETLRLLVSELVTNSIRHARLQTGEKVHLRVATGEGVIRVEVRNPGSWFKPSKPVPRKDLSSGWGLYLVDSLADRWGVDRDTVTCV